MSLFGTFESLVLGRRGMRGARKWIRLDTRWTCCSIRVRGLQVAGIQAKRRTASGAGERVEPAAFLTAAACRLACVGAA